MIRLFYKASYGCEFNVPALYIETMDYDPDGYSQYEYNHSDKDGRVIDTINTSTTTIAYKDGSLLVYKGVVPQSTTDDIDGIGPYNKVRTYILREPSPSIKYDEYEGVTRYKEYLQHTMDVILSSIAASARDSNIHNALPKCKSYIKFIDEVYNRFGRSKIVAQKSWHK